MADRGPLFLLALLLLMLGIAETAEAGHHGLIIANFGHDFYELGKAQGPSLESGS